MSSTDFNTPPIKLIMLAVSLVVGLHVLTAVALVAIKPPAPTIELPTVTPPIEIQLLPPPPVEIEEIVIKEIEEEPVKKVKTQSKAKPVAAAKPKVVKKPKSVDKLKSIVKKTVKPIVKEEKRVAVKSKPIETRSQNNDQQLPKTNQPTAAEIEAKRLEAQRLEAERRKIQAALEAEELRKEQALDKFAQDKANAEAKKAAQLQAQEIADAKKAQDIADAKTAANRKPASFEVTAAHWSVTPDFYSFDFRDYNFPNNTFSVVLSMSVSANGTISNRKIKKSSGDNKFDKELLRKLGQGKLKPFDRNGTSVQGVATLPLRYNIN